MFSSLIRRICKIRKAHRSGTCFTKNILPEFGYCRDRKFTFEILKILFFDKKRSVFTAFIVGQILDAAHLGMT